MFESESNESALEKWQRFKAEGRPIGEHIPDFSVVVFRRDFMPVSKEYLALHKKSGQKSDSAVNKDFLTSF